jgi:hypothetical protein
MPRVPWRPRFTEHACTQRCRLINPSGTPGEIYVNAAIESSQTSQPSSTVSASETRSLSVGHSTANDNDIPAEVDSSTNEVQVEHLEEGFQEETDSETETESSNGSGDEFIGDSTLDNLDVHPRRSIRLALVLDDSPLEVLPEYGDQFVPSLEEGVDGWEFQVLISADAQRLHRRTHIFHYIKSYISRSPAVTEVSNTYPVCSQSQSYAQVLTLLLLCSSSIPSPLKFQRL